MNTRDKYGDKECARMILDKSITEFEDSEIVTVGVYSFYNCSSLTSIDLPAATSIGTNALYNCSSLTSIDLPAATSIGNSAFCNCSSLTSIDLHVATSISINALYNCSGLVTLIIRTAITVCTYATTSRSSDPSNANLKIYVPSALLDAYKSATNWSRFADHFVVLEDYTVDGTTTGEMNKDADGNIVARE